jgi:hypothetical protein
MKKATQELSFCTDQESWSVLEEIAREGARQMLQLALENEVNEYIKAHSGDKDAKGKQVAVKNGYHPERSIITGLGPIQIKQFRVDDRKLSNYGDTERLARYFRSIYGVYRVSII